MSDACHSHREMMEAVPHSRHNAGDRFDPSPRRSNSDYCTLFYKYCIHRFGGCTKNILILEYLFCNVHMYLFLQVNVCGVCSIYLSLERLSSEIPTLDTHSILNDVPVEPTALLHMYTRES